MDRTRSTASAVLTLGAVDRYDVIVVGLGAMGSATAAALARRGVDVLGVEQFGAVHDRGSSHGASRIVRMAYFEHPDYVPLLQRAYEGWARLEATTGRRLITWSGALMIGRPDGGVVAGTLDSASRWELPHELLDGAAMAEAFPQFVLDDGEVAVFERNAGVVHPEHAVRSARRRRRAPARRCGSSPPSAAGRSATAAWWSMPAENQHRRAGCDHRRAVGAPARPPVPPRSVRTVTYHYAPPSTPALRRRAVPRLRVGARRRGLPLRHGRSRQPARASSASTIAARRPTRPARPSVSPAEKGAMDEQLAARIPGLAGPASPPPCACTR